MTSAHDARPSGDIPESHHQVATEAIFPARPRSRPPLPCEPTARRYKSERHVRTRCAASSCASHRADLGQRIPSDHDSPPLSPMRRSVPAEPASHQFRNPRALSCTFAFAGALLMPRSALRRFTPSDPADLARHFDVSEPFARAHLKRIERLDPGHDQGGN